MEFFIIKYYNASDNKVNLLLELVISQLYSCTFVLIENRSNNMHICTLFEFLNFFSSFVAYLIYFESTSRGDVYSDIYSNSCIVPLVDNKCLKSWEFL